MNFEQALIHELKGITGFGTRVYPLNAPESNAQSGVPYCIIVSSEGLRNKSLDGYQNGKSVPGEINIIAGRYGDLKALTESVIDRLVSIEQRNIGIDGPFIQEITYEEPVELYEDKPALYRCLIDFRAYF